MKKLLSLGAAVLFICASAVMLSSLDSAGAEKTRDRLVGRGVWPGWKKKG